MFACFKCPCGASIYNNFPIKKKKSGNNFSGVHCLRLKRLVFTAAL